MPDLAPGVEIPDEYDEDLRLLVQRIVGFVYMSLQLNTIVETVEVLRANPEFAKRLLGLSEKSDA
jgi:hypothetical protein